MYKNIVSNVVSSVDFAKFASRACIGDETTINGITVTCDCVYPSVDKCVNAQVVANSNFPSFYFRASNMSEKHFEIIDF